MPLEAFLVVLDLEAAFNSRETDYRIMIVILKLDKFPSDIAFKPFIVHRYTNFIILLKSKNIVS